MCPTNPAAASTWSAPTVDSTFSKVTLLSRSSRPWSDKVNPRATRWTSSSSNSSKSPANRVRRHYLTEKCSKLIRDIRWCNHSKMLRGPIICLSNKCKRYSSRKLVLNFSLKRSHRELGHLQVRCLWMADNNSKSMVAFRRLLHWWEWINRQFRCSHSRLKTGEEMPKEEKIIWYQ